MSELTSFFTKVQEEKKAGKEIVELHVGDPAVDTPPDISEAGIQAITRGKTHYTSPFGTEELRELIARKYHSSHAENVLISMGARVILAGIFYSFLGSGDRVMIPSPYYPSFRDLVEYFGGDPILVDTSVEDFLLSAAIVEEVLQKKGVPRFLIINSPNNPAGTVYSRKELEKIVGLSREWGFNLIFDECYHHFSPFEVDFREICPEAIVVNSCSKTYAMSGWRVGWCVAPTDIIQGVKDYLSVRQGSGCSFAQEGAIEAIEHNRAINDFSRERKLVCDWLDSMNIPYPEPEGGFYVFPDFSKFLQGDIANTWDLAVYLLGQTGVAVAPGEAFGEISGRIRISYCLDEKKLKEGLERIKTLLNK